MLNKTKEEHLYRELMDATAKVASELIAVAAIQDGEDSGRKGQHVHLEQQFKAEGSAMMPEPGTKSYAVCCPVCGGRGIVPLGFYDLSGGDNTTNAAPETCRSCGGKGYIVAEEKPDLEARLAEAEEVIDYYSTYNGPFSKEADSYRKKYPKGQ